MGNIEEGRFLLGEKVKISLNHHWAKGATGVIAVPPDAVNEMFEDWNDGFYREVKTTCGEKRFYWIKLYTSQLDADGDGPYEQAEIECNYIERVI
ncbi:MAG: hypothetical protein KF685_07340 [Acidobacteria bacterium]|nr:hypothetical protein [Acidobacteriota bacterium]